MQKYKNKKITVDGVVWDSRKEYRRWRELQLFERAGEIYGLRRQVKYDLLPSQYATVETKKGTKRVCIERPVRYIADFVYTMPNGEMVVEDTKGYRTADYVIKRKLMLYLHNIQIREV